MTTREIQSSDQEVVCDVCGRTLLRGERAEVYLSDGTSRAVCELCKDRALHEGWDGEGSAPPLLPRTSAPVRRRSLLGRLRGTREALREHLRAAPPPHDEADGSSRPAAPATRAAPATPAARQAEAPEAARPREPRRVRAVPTSAEHKMRSAVGLFNASEHRRTVAGIARSLGAPDVAVINTGDGSSLVTIVVSWELCWYRYEVDLADDPPRARGSGRGYELSELAPDELRSNAHAGEDGSLALRHRADQGHDGLPVQ